MMRAVALLSLGLLSQPAALGAEVPSGFEITTILDNLNTTTAFTFTPDGRIFILDQTGTILVVKEGQRLPQPLLTVEVDAYWERGLIGLALHPDFPSPPHLFINHTPGKPYTRHRISRFTIEGNQALPDSEKILLEGDDQSRLGGRVPHGHQGGPIRFGPDHKLYIALGEQTAGKPSQSIQSLLGKILRINPDGSIPPDNPFFKQTTGKYRSIWATGIRNPYGLDFHPVTGELYENDVGQSAWEEINLIRRGANYGWPEAEGASDNPAFTNPIHAYPPVIGRSITGGTFYRGGTQPFPPEYLHQYFFLDFMNHWIRILDPESPQKSRLFGKNFNGPVDIRTGPDGGLYVLNRGTIWRDNKRHVDHAGSLQRISYPRRALLPNDAESPQVFPPDLSSAGVFKNLTTLQPTPAFHRFHLNQPRWRPDISMSLWIRVPENRMIRPEESEIWRFPDKTTIIQHFETAQGVPLETHLYWATSTQCFRAAAYRWDADHKEARLVEDSEIVSYGDEGRHWFSPGHEACLNLNTSITGFVLELTTRQLNATLPNGSSQLQQWRTRGWLPQDITRLIESERLVSLDDPKASLHDKIRSYLDANCAACHYPDGPSQGGFDARFHSPDGINAIINTPLRAGDLGIKGAHMVVPGSPEKSILYQRVHRKDFFRMPPVVLNKDRSPLEDILRTWIESMTD